ncbi:hypothetical protein C0993_005258 [Termitomyces sp. T159_Od127]|nr:hypothetical protein C0993_005258 [Termitomyces sp. T159_Od127]
MGRVFKSSFDGTRPLIVAKNGFVNGVTAAYVKHYNLVIRPDDVWIAILTQLNFYINAHAEELRDKFVDHQGQKTLVLSSSTPLVYPDSCNLFSEIRGQIHENVIDKSLIPWILPNFSTTTANDEATCSVVIMNTLKEHVSHLMLGGCGIPFLTLDGTQMDWISIVARLERLSEFGSEPELWARMLRVVLMHFIRAFYNQGVERHFWESMVHDVDNRRPSCLSGWIGVFCAWDARGKFRLEKLPENWRDNGFGDGPSWAFFDGFRLPPMFKIVEGFAEVDVSLFGRSDSDSSSETEYHCSMLAGHMGFHMDGRSKTVHITPHWFLYFKGEKQHHSSGFWMQ